MISGFRVELGVLLRAFCTFEMLHRYSSNMAKAKTFCTKHELCW